MHVNNVSILYVIMNESWCYFYAKNTKITFRILMVDKPMLLSMSWSQETTLDLKTSAFI